MATLKFVLCNIKVPKRSTSHKASLAGETKSQFRYASQDHVHPPPPFDWCLTVPAQWQADGEISIQTFPACYVSTICCMGDIMQDYKALQYLFRYWLPCSRYQPANLPGLEIYRQRPDELG